MAVETLRDINVNEFAKWLSGLGFREAGVAKYRRVASKFLHAFAEVSAAEITPSQARSWVMAVSSAVSGRHEAYLASRQLWRFLQEAHRMELRPLFGGWKPPAQRSKKPLGHISGDEILALRVCPTITDRARALTRLLSETGARCSAVGKMRVEDLVEQPNGTGVARIRQEKTGQDLVRAHPVSRTCVEAVKLFRRVSRNRVWLWGMQGARGTKGLDSDTIEHVVKKAIYEAFGEGNPATKRMNVHAFRHAFANELRRRGADMETIRDALGHTDMSVTQIYFRTSERTRLAAQQACLTGSYEVGAPPIVVELDPTPEMLRWRLRMYGHEPIGRVELGPIKLIEVDSQDMAFEIFGDSVAYAKGKVAEPSGSHHWQRWPAGYASRLEVFDRKREEVLWAWKREV